MPRSFLRRWWPWHAGRTNAAIPHNLYVRISYQRRFMLPDQSLYLDTKFCRVEEPSTALLADIG